MRRPLAALALGAVFGFLLAWTRMSDPDAIRRMLLLEEAYFFLIFFAAIPVAFVGTRLVRRGVRTSLLTREPISWQTARPERRHVVGSVVFGAGWAISSSCPGPIAAQLGQGIGWSVSRSPGSSSVSSCTGAEPAGHAPERAMRSVVSRPLDRPTRGA